MLKSPAFKTTFLTALSVAFSLCFACATPMVAFGVYAALTMTRGHALATTVVIWLANQLVGYGLLGYPMTENSFQWGAALGLLALAATYVANIVFARSGRSLQSVLGAFAASFVAYQGIMFAVALVIGGMESMTPSIIGWAGVVNLAALAGLYGSYRLARTTQVIAARA
ncbi:MAG: hypothetical protein EBR02_08225 [Alphaproteobacteria bacterium]|nr:hypothetical protein [Alphaproteobacteria bacterium]